MFEPDAVAVNVPIGPGNGFASKAQITEPHPNVRVVVLAAFADALHDAAYLAAADDRDARADLRDAAANRREENLDRARLLAPQGTYGDDWPERRNAALDRRHSKDDRTASRVERIHLTGSHGQDEPDRT